MNSFLPRVLSGWKVIIVFSIVFFSPGFLPSYCGERKVFIREDFDSLDNWRPLFFPKIKRHSRYTVIRDHNSSSLKAESDSSASAIVYRKEFNVYDYPKIRWRWKIENVYKKGTPGKKSGDDYPVRIYIIFKYDPEKASLGQKIRYGLAKKIYGEYPPASSLNYVWANKEQTEKILTNPYADEAKMIIKEAGGAKAGIWVEEEANILEDYKKVFGSAPPSVASIAIMNDSDNTGESSVSYVDYIEVYR